MKTLSHKIRHLAIQALRRSAQVFVLLWVITLVYLSLYAHYRAANVLDDETEMTGFRGFVLREMDERIDSMDDPQAFLDANKGNLWAMRVGGWELADPLAALEPTFASKTFHAPLFASILIPVIVTLLFGKVFCSWICPANLLFEITGKLRALLRLAEIKPGEVRFSRINKYVLLVVGLIVAAIVGLPLFALIYPPAALSRFIHAWIFGTSVTGILILLGVIVLVELAVSPRWWCRTMCPGGALYGLIGWPRLLRVKLNSDRCTHCHKCKKVCDPGLDPVAESYGLECDNCGRCVKCCPEQALYFTVGLPEVKKRKEPKAGASASKVVTSIIILAVILGTAATAHAHHILGLPHYSYKENYPQAPVLEYPAQTGPYDLLFVCYPGEPVPGESAKLVFDIKNRDTEARYPKPIGVRVLQTFTFGDNREVLPSTTVNSYDGVLHEVVATFPEDGEYVVELTMDVEGKEEVIAFLMIAGKPSSTTSILIAIGCAFVVFLVIVRAIKLKRQRRDSAKQALEQEPSADI